MILPRRNARDLDEVPEEIRKTMQFILVDRIDEALDSGLASLHEHSRVAHRHVDRDLNRFDEEILAIKHR